MKTVKILISLALLLVLTQSQGFAQPPNASQELGGIERTRELEKREDELSAEIKKKREKPIIKEEKPLSEVMPALPSEKVLIKKIVVAGAALIPEKDIRDIVAPFENKELPLTEMQKAADLITDAYRKKGYITSRAYIPPQKIENSTFEIRVIEGNMGELEVKGNRYYKAFLFKKKFKFNLSKGEAFNYYILAKVLRKINEQPDRFAKAVLVPGKEPGATDIVLEVKDSLPAHAGFNYDNYGSRYILNDRYQFSASHNNLLGFEDIFQFQYTITQGESYRLIGGSYVVPFTEKLKVGFSALWAKLHLLNDYKPLDVRGSSGLYSFFATQSIFEEDKYSINMNFGFDIKDVYNYQFNQETSRDKMRVAKMGVDADLTDALGRTIFTNGIEIGIPSFMGGLKAKDPRASRVGSGGEFVKYVMNLYRLQPMPFESTILCKNQLQVSNKPLTSTEQFQIGGIINTRGYPPAELVGDLGLSTTTEWSFPVYIIPKNLKIPTTQISYYDTVRLVAFYDYGNVRLKNPGGTASKYNQLSDFGWGVRFNLPKHFNFRADFAYPIDKASSDGKDARAWVQLSSNF